MAGSNINLNVSAGGLQQSIQQQVNNAQQALNRRPLKLKLDAKGFQQPLGKITGDMSEFQKSLDASVARTFAFGAAVGVVNKVSDAFKALTQATIEVQQELKNINVLLGLSVSNLNNFSSELFDVAKNTAQTFKTVATAATEFSRQGLSAEETLKRVNDAMILTRLSGLGAEQAVASLTAAVNGFKKEAISSTEVINRLANVDASFAVSSKDLADALARAGSTAQGAKVQFNELLAAVTSVQQQTARGGAVIGNAFKSIFTRLQRSGVQDALEAIGVATRNVDGSFRSGIAVIKDYARTYNTLTDAQRAYTSEQIAGVFQINNLKALVNDLNSSFSIYDRALKVANGSTNQAAMRNEELNKTFAALIAQTTASMQQLGAALGNLGGEEVFTRLIKGVQAFADFFNKVLDPEEGNQFAIKFVKAIGSFIAGPGLIIIGGAFIKLFTFISKQAGAAVKQIFAINTETQRQQQLQQAILATIMSEESVYKKILANAGNQAAQEKIVLDTLKQQTAQRSMQQKFLQQMAASPAFKNVAVQGGVIAPRAGRRGASARRAGLAGGHIPNFAVAAANTDEFLVRDFAATQEAKAIKAGVGGASPGARVAKVAFNPRKDAILNPDMVAAMGLPAGAQPIGAAGGFLPNFAQTIAQKQAGVRKKTRDEQTSVKVPLVGGPNLSVITPNVNQRGFTSLQDATRMVGGKKVKFDFADTRVAKLGPLGRSGKDDYDLLAHSMLQHRTMLDDYVKQATMTFFKSSGASKLFKPSFADNASKIKSGNVAQKMIAEKSGARGELFEEIILGLQNDIKREGGAGGGQDPIDLNPTARAGPNVVRFFNDGQASGGPRKYEVKSGTVETMTTKYLNDVIFNASRPAGSVDRGGSGILRKILGKKGAESAKGITGAAAVKGGAVGDLKGPLRAVGPELRSGDPDDENKYRYNAQNKLTVWEPNKAKTGNLGGWTQVQKFATPKGLRPFAQGFLPNFANPLERAFKTERKMGAKRPEFRTSPFPHVADGASQPDFAAVMRDHPEGLDAAIAASAEMQGFAASGFTPNFAATAISSGGRAAIKALNKRIARRNKVASKGDGEGMGGLGPMMMMMALHQGAQYAPEGMGRSTLQGAGTGAMFGKTGALAGAGVGALIAATGKLGPVAQEAAGKLEELVAAQKSTSDSMQTYIELQGQLKDIIKKGDFAAADKVTAKLRDLLRSLPLEKFEKELAAAGGDLEKLTDILGRVQSDQLREKLGEGTTANLANLESQQKGRMIFGKSLPFGLGQDAAGAKKTSQAIGGDLSLLLNKSSAKEVEELQAVFKSGGLQGFIEEAVNKGLLDGAKAVDIKFALDKVDTKAIEENLSKSLGREVLAAETAEYQKRLTELSKGVREPLKELGDAIVNEVNLLQQRFAVAAKGLSSIGKARVGAMEKLGIISEFGALDMAANMAMRRNTAENKLPSLTEKQQGEPIPIAESFTKEGGLVVGKEEQQKRDQATDEMNKNIQADLQIQKEILRVQKATESYLALSSQTLSTEVVGELGALNDYIKTPGVLGGGGRAGAEAAGGALSNIKQLEGMFGIDLGREERGARARVGKFNAEEVFKSFGADVGKTNSTEEFIKRAQSAIDNIDTSTSAGVRRAEILRKVLEGMKKQQEVANMNPEEFAKKQQESAATLAKTLGINTGPVGQSNEFATLLGGMSRTDQAKITVLHGIEKQSKDLVELYKDTLKAQQENAKKRAEIERLKEQVNKNKQEEVSEMTVTSQKTVVTTSSPAANAGGFVPTFSPVQKQVRRAMETERAMGGSPMVGFHPSVGLHVRDKNTQKNFASVKRDHPEGLVRAVANSKAIQGAAGGFAPNFANNIPASHIEPDMYRYFTRTEVQNMGPGTLANIQAKLQGMHPAARGKTPIDAFRRTYGFMPQPATPGARRRTRNSVNNQAPQSQSRWEKFKSGAKGLGSKIKSAPGRAWEGIKGIGGKVAETAKGTWTAVKGVKEWKSFLPKVLRFGGQAIGSLINPLLAGYDIYSGDGLLDGSRAGGSFSGLGEDATNLGNLGALFPVNWAKQNKLYRDSNYSQQDQKLKRKGFGPKRPYKSVSGPPKGRSEDFYENVVNTKVADWGTENVAGALGNVTGSAVGTVLAAIAGLGTGGWALTGAIPIITATATAGESLMKWMAVTLSSLNKKGGEGLTESNPVRRERGKWWRRQGNIGGIVSEFQKGGQKKEQGLWEKIQEEAKLTLPKKPEEQKKEKEKVMKAPQGPIEGFVESQVMEAYNNWLDSRDGMFAGLLAEQKTDNLQVAMGAATGIPQALGLGDGTDLLKNTDAQLGKIQLPNFRGTGLRNMYPSLGIRNRKRFRSEVVGKARTKTLWEVSEKAEKQSPAFKAWKKVVAAYEARDAQTMLAMDASTASQWKDVEAVVPEQVTKGREFMNSSDDALQAALEALGTSVNPQRDVWSKLDPKLVTGLGLERSLKAGRATGGDAVGQFLKAGKDRKAGKLQPGENPIDVRNRAYKAYLKGDRNTLKAMGFYQAQKNYKPQDKAAGDYNLFGKIQEGSFGGIYDKAPDASKDLIDEKLKRIFGGGVPDVPVGVKDKELGGLREVINALAIGTGNGEQALDLLREKVAASQMGRPITAEDIKGNPQILTQMAGFGSGFIPNFNKMGEVISSIAAGYKNPVGLGDVKSMNIPGVGKSYYNNQETVMQAAGMQQPFIVPPKSSRASSSYANEVRGKFGFDPYKANHAQGFVPNLFGPNTSPVKLDSKDFKEETNIFKTAVNIFKEALAMPSRLELNLGGSISVDIDIPALQDAVKGAVQGAVSQGLDTQIQGIVMGMAEAIVQKGLTY